MGKAELEGQAFYRHLENAVMSQIWVAMCTYLLVEYFRWDNGITPNAPRIVHIIQLCWFERRNIVVIFMSPERGG